MKSDFNKGYFTFDNESSEDFGLYTAGSGAYNSPERISEVISVPGRNGDIIIDGGKFSNVDVVFTVVAKDNFKQQALDTKAWLLSKFGYKRLEDSFNPDYYRRGKFTGNIEWTIGELLRYGSADLKFNCKPQLYLKAGETPVAFTAAGTITNPTRFDSSPLIRVNGTGSGTVTIGNQIITLTGISEYIDIDSVLMDCYKGTLNQNNLVSLSEFPKLKPGPTGISFTGDITSVEITGRWWTL